MRKFILIFSLCSICILTISFFPIHKVFADPPDELDYHESYARAQVIQVLSQGIQTYDHIKNYNESLKVAFLEGKEKGKKVVVSYSNDATFGINEKIQAGDIVVIDSKPDFSGKKLYTLYEPYRLTNLWWILGFFILLIIIIAGKKGIGALIGLSISLLTILTYIMPNILKGQDPITVSTVGCIIILFFTTFIAHGISLKTCVAVISTALSLLIAAMLALFSVHFTFLLGLGNENIYSLQLATTHTINPQGLLLGSILIGTLGALNDVTTTQAITIFTLARENPRQSFSYFFFKGMTIGREHIASIINTLVLAYAGSSLIIFLFFAFNPVQLPLWLILNNESTMQEIVKTIVGSCALILAVPITTALGTFTVLHVKKNDSFP